MEIFLMIFFILLGLGLLVGGGELLTFGASRLARGFGMRPIIIGLTVVAFGTSMPEAFVSFFSAIQNKGDIAVANVVGSNIFNLMFILGVTALVRPLKIETGTLRREIPFVVGGSVLVYVLSYDRVLSFWDGVILLSLFFSFLWVCFIQTPKDETKPDDPVQKKTFQGLQILTLLGSLALLVFGARLFVMGAVDIARQLGVSELVVGLTVVAAGTSLPEFVTSVVAALRGKDDLAVGNVTGSNIFNILFILGITALLQPLGISEIVFLRDIFVMVFASLLIIPMLKTGFVISRTEGFLLVLGYIAYVILLAKKGGV